ncbi:hypothetical protein EYE40_01995 [Glaciihabitans arcticus]|uniref:Uncharacterized protein n=1 Tax=Glaciihabitans arcticus TaxID=2668039 RepID=A0A4Q9GQK7_9MICO|nr:hypothetical protein [Glaciihabitans arcticus]TBN56264.1 hypothetical protein EYE40_01995 [Glaciihabitans arcticus]
MSANSGLLRTAGGMLVITVLVALLSGCVHQFIGFTPPGTFDEVDAMARELDIGEAEQMVFEERDGGDYPGVPPTLLLVFEGQRPLSLMNKSLEEAGYTSSPGPGAGLTYWEREVEGERFQLVTVQELSDGDQFLTSYGLKDMSSEGIAVHLTS